MTLIYKHIRKDTNEIFYIGIGSKKRLYTKRDRNQHWHNIVNKAGYVVEIIQENLSWKDACIEEIKFIKKYGRNDLGLGNLVNMTDGGDGQYNPSKETRKKMSENNGRYWKYNKVTDETRKKMSESAKGKIISNETRKKISGTLTGRTLSEETRKKISVANSNPSEETKKKISKKLKGIPQKKIKCPHCDKVGGTTMYRWHFDNCKYK